MQHRSQSVGRLLARTFAVVALLVATVVGSGAAQSNQPTAPTAEMRDRGHRMLAQLRDDLKKYYYDSTYRGLDMEGKVYRSADSAIDAAANNNFIMGALAQYLANLDDSHTAFFPPGHTAQVNYGFAWQIFGDSAFITMVKKDSDAEKKGLKRGDALLVLDRFRVQRSSWHTLRYVYGALSPRAAVRLVLKSPGDSATHEMTVMSEIKLGERVVDYTDIETIRRLIDRYEREETANHRWVAIGPDSLLYWKMSSFESEDRENIDNVLKDARSKRGLVLDLRGNGGGSIDTQRYIIGQFVDHDLPYAITKLRKKTDTLVAKGQKDPLRSMLVIMLDAGSASSSEMTAYALQQEGRAIIVGDRSMGAVMGAFSFGHGVGGVERKLDYGIEVTIEDVIMTDGTRLEKRGVIPNELVIPTSADIASRRDPALAKALDICGITRTPEQAYRLARGMVAVK